MENQRTDSGMCAADCIDEQQGWQQKMGWRKHRGQQTALASFADCHMLVVEDIHIAETAAEDQPSPAPDPVSFGQKHLHC
jgi:hypothetical protein